MWKKLKYGLRGLLASLLFIPVFFSIAGFIWISVEGFGPLLKLRYVLPVLFLIFSIPVYLLWRKAIIQKKVKPFAIGFAIVVAPLSLIACWYAYLLIYVPTSLRDAPAWGKNFGDDEASCKLLPHSQSDLGQTKTTSGVVAGFEYSSELHTGFKIFYTYIVDGKEYKAATIKSKNFPKAKEIAEQHPRGSSIDVNFNPENPQMSYVLENEDLGGVYDKCNKSYKWLDQFVLPEYMEKEKQSQLADCIMARLNLPEFKKEIHAAFPEFSDERIQHIGIGKVDGSMIMDYYENRIEIWSTIPSSMTEYKKHHPVQDFIRERLNQEMKACMSSGN